jgi:hypothetical protein
VPSDSATGRRLSHCRVSLLHRCREEAFKRAEGKCLKYDDADVLRPPRSHGPQDFLRQAVVCTAGEGIGTLTTQMASAGQIVQFLPLDALDYLRGHGHLSNLKASKSKICTTLGNRIEAPSRGDAASRRAGRRQWRRIGMPRRIKKDRWSRRSAPLLKLQHRLASDCSFKTSPLSTCTAHPPRFRGPSAWSNLGFMPA